MAMKRWISPAVAAALCAVATLAAAQTLYKLIDKNGKVTYSETAPKDFPGQVIRIDINPDANTATLPKLPPRDAAPAANSGARAPDSRGSAQEKLDAARKALAQARENPGEDDVTWIGNKGGGTRAVPNETYRAKLEKLEADVKAAEEEVRRAERR
jgi:hypothetical protein